MNPFEYIFIGMLIASKWLGITVSKTVLIACAFMIISSSQEHKHFSLSLLLEVISIYLLLLFLVLRQSIV